MEKSIILSHLLDYLKLKNINYKACGKVVMIDCPFCEKEGLNAQKIPNTYIINCFSCNKKYNLIDIAKHLDKLEDKEEKEVIHYLKELLDIKITTTIEKENTEDYFKFYEANGFDLVPCAVKCPFCYGKGCKKCDNTGNYGKNPIEKDWTNKEHKDKAKWAGWVSNGLNLGVKTGAVSGITIIDIDQKDIPEDIKKNMGKTLLQKSAKGWHLFYKYDKDFPKTGIFEEDLKTKEIKLKIDIENDGGQVIIYPSKTSNIQRKIENLIPIIEMPKELKKFLQSKITTAKPTYSEGIREDIKTGNFKIDPVKLALKNNNLEGSCNSEFIKLGGILRKQLNTKQTGYVLHILNKHLLEKSMDTKSVSAMIYELDKYTIFDEQTLAKKIMDYMRGVEEAGKTEVAMAVAGTNRGKDYERVNLALEYLVKEGQLAKKGKTYQIMKRAIWSEDLIEEGKPIDFEMPYFNDVANFNWGDMLIIGSRNKKGKTHISMNIVKQLVEQGKKPYYISLETGSRFKKIALQLGLKEGDLKHTFHVDPTQIELEPNAITIIDWLLIADKSKTDLVLKRFIEQLYKSNGILIVFMQLKNNKGQENEYFAPNMVMQFPALSARYIYDADDVGEFGKFIVDVIREPKLRIKSFEIPCKYNWTNKTLMRIEDQENETKNDQ